MQRFQKVHSPIHKGTLLNRVSKIFKSNKENWRDYVTLHADTLPPFKREQTSKRTKNAREQKSQSH